MKGSSESTSQREFLIITSKISKSYYCQVYSSTPWRRECLAELINIGIGSHSSSTSFPPFWFLFQLLHCSFPRLQVVAGDQVGGGVHQPAPCQHHARVWNLNTGRSALNFTTSFSQLANSRGIAKTVFLKVTLTMSILWRILPFLPDFFFSLLNHGNSCCKVAWL